VDEPEQNGAKRMKPWPPTGLSTNPESRSTASDCVDDEHRRMGLALTRDLLLVGPDNTDLKLEYLKILVDEGLPAPARPQDVIIVGAGMAGLSAGYLLTQAGHRVTLLEADAARIGGRVKTVRHDPARGVTSPFADLNLYAEVGPARIPDHHPLTLALVDRLGLRRRRVGNTNAVRPTEVTPPVIYRSFTGAIWAGQPQSGDDRATVRPEQARQHWIETRIEQLGRPDLVDPRGREPLDAWIEGWARLIHDRGRRAIGPAVGSEWEIDGGSWLLPYAFEESVGSQIRFDRRVTRIEYYDPARPDARYDTVGAEGPRVVVTTQSEESDRTETYDADLVIVTVPFSELQRVAVEPPMSRPKRRAIAQLSPVPVAAIHLEFSRRWWEFSEDDWTGELEAIATGLAGKYTTGVGLDRIDLLGVATSVTINARQRTRYHQLRTEWRTIRPDGDPAGRNLPDQQVFSSNAVPGSLGGVVLAGCSWAGDALRWTSMADDERYIRALRGLQDIHGDRIEVFYTGRGSTQTWTSDQVAFDLGAGVLPGDSIELQPVIPAPEGPLHFAGQRSSVLDSGIEGALEAGVRAALAVNGTPPVPRTGRVAGDRPARG
jgi:monoamine oxidase